MWWQEAKVGEPEIEYGRERQNATAPVMPTRLAFLGKRGEVPRSVRGMQTRERRCLWQASREGPATVYGAGGRGVWRREGQALGGGNSAAMCFCNPEGTVLCVRRICYKRPW